jgi:hypothetical protein
MPSRDAWSVLESRSTQALTPAWGAEPGQEHEQEQQPAQQPLGSGRVGRRYGSSALDFPPVMGEKRSCVNRETNAAAR